VLSRRILGLAFASALAAAGLGVAREPGVAHASPRVPSAVEIPMARAVKHVARKAAASQTGNLAHPSRLATLYEALGELEAKRAKTDVRIAQLGDSHTASDYGTSIARARLAARFGDGGRGFIPLGQPYRRLFQAGEAMARGNGFEADGAPLFGARAPTSDGLFGLAGFAMDSRLAGATMTSELTASADSFEVAYLAQPGGGTFELSIDGKSRGRVSTGQASRGSAYRSFAASRGPHTVEARALGDGPTRIFGVRLEDEAVGITFDSFGMNGARASTPLAADESHFGEQLARLAPALVIVAYGTNESGDSMTTPEEHADAIRRLAQRVQKGAPGASCLVLGPPDRDAGGRTLPKLAQIIAAQERAADDAGCAFFDQFAAMGASGAIGRWSAESPPRARRDLVHLTRAGYAFLAEALVRDLLAGYETWKIEPR
jgi:lysophospholipase L1-like esterase